jgi:DNA topoisomerase-1
MATAKTEKSAERDATKKTAAKRKKASGKNGSRKTAAIKNLVIVESPAKAKTIEKFLGTGYAVRASNGHLRDLPKSKIGVDIENDFTPTYTTIRGKAKLIRELKADASGAQNTYLATDPDREGEAISWHIANLLGMDTALQCRIEFNEITKSAVTSAIKNPRSIDLARVDAQQARRILDRLVGYKLSPLLWRKVKKGLSAGRVQSVAVKIICDREAEIRDFVPEEYWTITAWLLYEGKSKPVEIEAKFHGRGGKKVKLENEAQTQEVLDLVSGQPFTVDSVSRTAKQKRALPPFITSTLQQDASRKLNFTAKKTMMLAQMLYEGVQGMGGLITYMRTDSMRISAEATAAAAEHIKNTYGENYLPEKPNVYSSKRRSQDAHEAIRPTYVENDPKKMKSALTSDQYRLYKLIYDRYLASQMVPARIETLSYNIVCNGCVFKASGSRVLFKGHLIAYDSSGGSEKEPMLPDMEKGQVLALEKIEPKQNFTQPPARYNEASLIKFLEEKGIGRPSTYAPIISTIQDRGYVRRENKAFIPTELGEIVTGLMVKNFPDIVNIEFTAGMENKLDNIEKNGTEWKKIVADFYGPFEKELETAEEKIERIILPPKISDVKCEKCGAMMVYKEGRYGEFLACPNFPECRNTKPVVKKANAKCPKCGGEIVIKKSGKSRKEFYGCENYPECDFVSWGLPLEEKCEKCGSYMVESRLKNGRKYKKCSNEECETNKKNKEKK